MGDGLRAFEAYGGLDQSAPDLMQQWARQLSANLEMIKVLAVQEQGSPAEDISLAAAIQSLREVLSALRVLEGVSGSIGHLEFLESELNLVINGRKSSMLTKRRRGDIGRPSKSEVQLVMMGAAAGAVQALSRFQTVDGAAKHVAKLLRKSNVRGWAGGEISHKSVEEWHSKFATKQLEKRAMDIATGAERYIERRAESVGEAAQITDWLLRRLAPDLTPTDDISG
ncbi:MAG: hypothetical protein ABI454_08840 [Sphingomicrobium sp.]